MLETVTDQNDVMQKQDHNNRHYFLDPDRSALLNANLISTFINVGMEIRRYSETVAVSMCLLTRESHSQTGCDRSSYADHIGDFLQAPDISVSQVIYNGYPGNTQPWNNFVSSAGNKGITLTVVQFF